VLYRDITRGRRRAAHRDYHAGRPENLNPERPDFKFSYSYPQEPDEPFAILEHLSSNTLLEPPVLRRK
jgi:hypothetical protein